MYTDAHIYMKWRTSIHMIYIYIYIILYIYIYIYMSCNSPISILSRR